MSYNFQYSSMDSGKTQNFQYEQVHTNKYSFTYDRDIFSDLSNFNTPIFVSKKDRGAFYNRNNLFVSDVSKEMFITIPLDVHRERYGIPYSEQELSHITKLNYDLKEYKNYIMPKLYKDISIENGYFVNHTENKRIIITNTEQTMYRNISYLNISDTLFAKISTKHLMVYNKLYASKEEISKALMQNKDAHLYKIKHNMFYAYNYFLNTPDNELGMYMKHSFLKRRHLDLSIVNNSVYKLIRDYVHNVLLKDSILAKEYLTHNILVNDRKHFYNRQDLKLGLYNKHYTLTNISNSKNLDIYKHTGFCDVYNIRDIFIKDNVLMSKRYHNLFTNNYKDYFAIKQSHNVLLSYDSIFIKKSSLDSLYIKNNILMYKDRHNVFITNSNKHLSKVFKGIEINKNIFAHKDNHLFAVMDYSALLSKDKHSFYVNLNNLHSYKDKHSFIIDEKNSLYTKNSFDVNIYESTISSRLNSKSYNIINDLTILAKDYCGLIINNEAQNVYKEKSCISIIENSITLSKDSYPLDIKLYSNSLGILIPSRHVIKNKHVELTYELKKQTYINTIKALDKTKIYTNINNNNLFTLDESKKTFLSEYHALQVVRSLKHLMLDKDNLFIQKGLKTAVLYTIININTKDDIHKAIKKTWYINKHYTMSSSYKHATYNEIKNISKKDKTTEYFFYDDLFVDKKYYNTQLSTYNYIWLNSKSKTTAYNCFSHIDISKDTIEAFVKDDSVAFSKASKYADVDKDLYVYKNNKPMLEDQSYINIHRESVATGYRDDFIFISKQDYCLNPIVQELTRMRQVVKNLEVNVEKHYNWAYVYQYEDPINPNHEHYGLDELLLPEKDVNYNSFKEVIFNEKTMTPKNPIKIIDNNTFIAKYPIKHPMTKYEEIGIEYIDVPSSLMLELFLRFYQIWYSNIFKFGNMGMVEALTLMLDYMYSYIVLNYSGSEYLEAALRTFRLIRWFGETSVMHNAEYIVSITYKDLRSQLNTGTCHIDNVMNGFFVNKSLGVISSNSMSFGEDAYVKLFVPNKNNTTISFSISLMSGSAQILINDEFIDVINNSKPFVSYDLEETDDINTITILRPSIENNSLCYIGNIIVKNGTYDDLKIDYNPELKAGNMPLNDVVNKMVMFANMYDNEKEVFEQIRKGNLGVGEVFKRLQEYWELHHQDKTKGKRLTIKEV